MASLGLEGVNRVLLAFSNQPLPFNTPHTPGNTDTQSSLSLATITFLCISERFFSSQYFFFYHASGSKLCVSLFIGLQTILEASKTVYVVYLNRWSPHVLVKISEWEPPKKNHPLGWPRGMITMKRRQRTMQQAKLGSNKGHPEQHGLCLWYELRRDEKRIPQGKQLIGVTIH